MITIAFIAGNRKIIKFSIEGRIVNYYDDIWKKGVQILPKDQNLIEKLQRSGKENLKIMARLIREANSGENKREYDKCHTEEQIANMIRKDCNEKGLMEVK